MVVVPGTVIFTLSMTLIRSIERNTLSHHHQDHQAIATAATPANSLDCFDLKWRLTRKYRLGFDACSEGQPKMIATIESHQVTSIQFGNDFAILLTCTLPQSRAARRDYAISYESNAIRL